MKEKFVITILSQLIAYFMYCIATYFLVLALDVALFGFWIFLNSFINLSFFLIEIGFDIIFFRASGKSNFSEQFSSYLIIKLFLIISSIFITFIFIAILQLWFFLSFLLLILFNKIIISITNIFLNNLKSKIKIFKAEIPYVLSLIGRNIFIAYLAFNISHITNPIFYLCIICLISDLILMIIIIIVSINDIRINKPKKHIIYQYLRDVKPLFINYIIYFISINLGNLILAFYFGNEELGYFSIVNIFIIPLFLILSGSIVPLYSSIFSKDFEKKDMLSSIKLLYIMEKYFSIFHISIILIILLYDELIFLIFLPKYFEAILYLNILIFYAYILGVTRPYPYFLMTYKKIRTVTRISSITFILTILFFIILIPRRFFIFPGLGLGSLGYAIAQIISYIIWMIFTRFYSYKYFGIKIQKKLILHIILGVITYIISLIIKLLLFTFLFHNLLILLLFSSLITLGLFFGLLFIFKELKKADIIFFLNIFRLKLYIESLKSEFSGDLSSNYTI